MNEAIRYLNKQYTAKTASEQLLHLNKAKIDFGLNIIYGAYGEKHSKENAVETAKLINEVKPNNYVFMSFWASVFESD